MKTARIRSAGHKVTGWLVLSLLGALSLGACKKPPEEEPTPIPVASAAPVPVQSATVVTPEDPPPASASAAPSASAPKGGPAPSQIGKCCTALQTNAKNAPPDQVLGYQAAIAVCQAAKSNPQAQQAFSQIRAALKNAAMPGACQ
jgi:hypothetical protein